MPWNYRLFRQDTPQSFEGDYLYFVAECYYDAKGKPNMYNGERQLVGGVSIQEAVDVYTMMNEAFDAPVIRLDAEGNFKKGTK